MQISLCKELEDTKVVIIIRKSRKNRQDNAQKKKVQKDKTIKLLSKGFIGVKLESSLRTFTVASKIVTRVTRGVSLMKQELITLSEQLSSPPSVCPLTYGFKPFLQTLCCVYDND